MYHSKMFNITILSYLLLINNLFLALENIKYILLDKR